MIQDEAEAFSHSRILLNQFEQEGEGRRGHGMTQAAWLLNFYLKCGHACGSCMRVSPQVRGRSDVLP
jgi:hypothetical protein